MFPIGEKKIETGKIFLKIPSGYTVISDWVLYVYDVLNFFINLLLEINNVKLLLIVAFLY